MRIEGVQWHAGYDEIAWIGVNLEGMLYDGWPIARLIKRELSNPLLLSEYRDRVPRPETVTVELEPGRLASQDVVLRSTKGVLPLPRLRWTGLMPMDGRVH